MSDSAAARELTGRGSVPLALALSRWGRLLGGKPVRRTIAVFSQLTTLGPVLFGVGFIAPLIAQSMDAASVSAPLGVSNVTFGLAIGLTLGVVARLRGRWV